MILKKIQAKILALTLFKLQFKKFGDKSLIINPLRIDGKKNIEIGNKVYVMPHTWIAAMPLSGNNEPKLKVKNGCTIGNFNHIYCTNSIIIGENVLTADKVYISDNLHNFSDISIPIKCQGIRQTKPVEIGSGSWLGENVCVIGASVGKNCVIGANSVVTKDIPDYSVAVGIPAKEIKKYNFETKKWEKA